VCLSAYLTDNSLVIMETGMKRTGFRSNWCNLRTCSLVYSVSGVMGCTSIDINSGHQVMAPPQVADRGTATNMEGSCEYIE
jgi:hypothetical protein